jgi:hypothetical protein
VLDMMADMSSLAGQSSGKLETSVFRRNQSLVAKGLDCVSAVFDGVTADSLHPAC